MYVTAVTALPVDLAVTLENSTGLHSFEKLAVAGLVLGLDLCYHLECHGYLGEAFFPGHFGGFRIEYCPFLVLALGGGFEVFQSGGDYSRRVCRRYLNHTAFEEFEELLGVLLFLLGCLKEDSGNLLVALFLGDTCKVGVSASGLGFSGE